MPSPVGGTTSLPQYLQQRKADSIGGTAGKTAPTVTPPNSGSPQAPSAPQPTATQPSPHPVSTTGNPTIPPAPPAGGVGGAVTAVPATGGMVNSTAAPTGRVSVAEQIRQRQAALDAGQAPVSRAPVGLVNPQQQTGGGLVNPMPRPTAVPPTAAQPAPPAAAAPAPNLHPAPTGAAPAAPPPIAVGDTGQTQPGGPIGLDRLRQVLEQALGGNQRYGDDLVARLREQSQHQLEDTRRTEEDRLRADAASRGVFHGSGLSTSLGDASQRYVRGLADAETGLLGRIADANAQDKQTAIGNVFQFGQGEQENQRLQAYIAQILAQAGSDGGPTIPGAVGEYGNLPQPGTADNTSIYEQLGRIFNPKPAAAAAGAAK